jgi:hypothetical protein
LPHDFVQMRGSDSRLLELVVGPTSIDSFVLANVTDERSPSVRSGTSGGTRCRSI